LFVLANSTYSNSSQTYFYYNLASTGGALFFSFSAYLESENNIFNNNYANKLGGAIAIVNCPNKIIKLFNTTYISNLAFSGGALYAD
jgi:hypothetical protein